MLLTKKVILRVRISTEIVGGDVKYFSFSSAIVLSIGSGGGFDTEDGTITETMVFSVDGVVDTTEVASEEVVINVENVNFDISLVVATDVASNAS